ncbi:hypothetical protein GOBAR_AA12365 [Gossypium barbadense]|uniref:Uncharacterized protein n=1 Tax=Gossypium barbadense TaxID=3634 RepID=A0A2P5XY61_GOSBA|nr:hypothetical protein GOBAR_AA12365 [Gossypium barbadense]
MVVRHGRAHHTAKGHGLPCEVAVGAIQPLTGRARGRVRTCPKIDTFKEVKIEHGLMARPCLKLISIIDEHGRGILNTGVGKANECSKLPPVVLHHYCAFEEAETKSQALRPESGLSSVVIGSGVLGVVLASNRYQVCTRKHRKQESAKSKNRNCSRVLGVVLALNRYQVCTRNTGCENW